MVYTATAVHGMSTCPPYHMTWRKHVMLLLFKCLFCADSRVLESALVNSMLSPVFFGTQGVYQVKLQQKYTYVRLCLTVPTLLDFDRLLTRHYTTAQYVDFDRQQSLIMYHAVVQPDTSCTTHWGHVGSYPPPIPGFRVALTFRFLV